MLVRGLSAIASVAEVSNVLAYGLAPDEAAALRSAGGTVRLLSE